MSARRVEGAAAHPELFQQNAKESPVSSSAQEKKGLVGEDKQASDDGEPLQLEHMMGFAGQYRNTIVALPNNEHIMAKSMGNLVCLENLQNPHDQKLLRGHDMPISAMAASVSGSFLATGQVGTKKYRGNAAPVFLWDTVTGERLITLKGITLGVSHLSFSHDERFLCGCGVDDLLYVWDLQSGEVALGQRLPAPASIMKFIYQQKQGHYVSYELVVGFENRVAAGILQYDPSRVQWSMSLQNYAVPAGGGLVRTFTCVDATPDGHCVYVGNSAGEMMVFHRQAGVYRAALPVVSNGVASLCALPNGDVCVGGGDGALKVVSGDGDLTWEFVQSATMDGPVRSVSCVVGGREILVNTASGAVYRMLAAEVGQSQLVGTGHTNSILCIALGRDEASGQQLFASGDTSGEVRVWDVADYANIATTSYRKSGAVLSIAMVGTESVISGYEDGFIRCNDAASMNRLLWYIPTAHRGGVSSLAVYRDASLQYFASGGTDGAVRVWRLANRELVTQYNDHTKPIVRILVDIKSPNVIHSCGKDCCVLSYDLKAARRIISHLVTTGTLCDMTQRKDSEQELVTCDNQGRLLHWDVDYRDPVVAVSDPSGFSLICCGISPSGKFLAFAGEDQLLKVLVIASQQVVSIGQAHSGTITGLLWTSDERQVITVGEDSCVCVWNFFLGGDEAPAEAK